MVWNEHQHMITWAINNVIWYKINTGCKSAIYHDTVILSTNAIVVKLSIHKNWICHFLNIQAASNGHWKWWRYFLILRKYQHFPKPKRFLKNVRMMENCHSRCQHSLSQSQLPESRILYCLFYLVVLYKIPYRRILMSCKLPNSWPHDH